MAEQRESANEEQQLGTDERMDGVEGGKKKRPTEHRGAGWSWQARSREGRSMCP